MRMTKRLCALLMAALLACANLPVAFMEDLEVDVLSGDAPAAGFDLEDGVVDEEVDPPVEAGGEVDGTGLTLDDGTGEAVCEDVDARLARLPETPVWEDAEEEAVRLDVDFDNEAAAAGYIYRAMHAQPVKSRLMLRAAYASVAGQRLSGVNLRLYNALKAQIQQVAAGERSDTVFYVSGATLYPEEYYSAADLGLESFVGEDNKLTDEARQVITDFIRIDINNVIRALVVDCPYDLYWYDKTKGMSWRGVSATFVGDQIRVTGKESGDTRYAFCVSRDYSSSGEENTYETDAAKAAAVKSAAANARQIIEANQSLGDLDKLAAYKQAVCDLVSYNRDASGAAYGDPWQLVWVFDGDPATNVVCEGYSKAFQFLCDESDFIDGRVLAVVSVTGDMSTGTSTGFHMWNMVNIDGANYMADLTNCDSGNVGYPNQLFLVGYTHMNDAGAYCFATKSTVVAYSFENRISNLFKAEDLTYAGDPVGPMEDWTALGDVFWKMNGAGTLRVMGSGPIPGFTGKDGDVAPWAGTALKRVSLESGVTGIGSGAFANCPNLIQITIPDSVQSIDEAAFDAGAFGRAGSTGLLIESCGNAEAIEYGRRLNLKYSFKHGEAIIDEAVAPTCVDAGLTQGSHCAICGEPLVPQKTVKATGHSPETVHGTAASCAEEGLTDGERCSVCGEWITPQQTIDRLAHTPETVLGFPATYASAGLSDGEKCSVCGAWIIPQTEIDHLVYPGSRLTQNGKNGTITVNLGERFRLTPAFADAAKVSVKAYKSSKTRAVSVDGGGVVTAKAEGSATITVTTSNKKKTATVIVKVVDPLKPTGVSIANGKKATLYLDETLSLNGVMKPDTAQSKLTWKSSKKSVASVDGSGLVTPHKEGTAKITVTTWNKKKATITVKVVDRYKPTGVRIANGKKATLYLGQTLPLNGVLKPDTARSNLIWKSSNAKVARVDASGLVTPIKEGTAKITVTTRNRKKATITVKVVDPLKPTGVSITCPGKTVKVGQTLQLGAALRPLTAQSGVTWKSANKKIATVDANGVVTGKKKGKVKITVTTSKNKKKATITINVVP